MCHGGHSTSSEHQNCGGDVPVGIPRPPNIRTAAEFQPSFFPLWNFN